MPKTYGPGDIIDQQANLPNLSIGPYQFYVNPWEFRMDEQRIQYSVPTKAGVGRFSYGVAARTYTIIGTFLNSGLDGLSGLQHVAPTFKKAHNEVPYYLTYAFFGLKRVKVYLNEVEIYQEQDMVNYIKYRILAAEYPPAGAPFVQQAASPGASLGGPPPVGTRVA
jgi:hypothetical protein